MRPELKGKIGFVSNETGTRAVGAMEARNPHAATLVADFFLSPDGAKILSDLEYGTPLKPTNYKLWYPESGMSVAQYDKAMEHWDKLLRELGRK